MQKLLPVILESQLSGASALIPAFSKGNANVGAVQKIIQTAKMLLGKSDALSSNVGLLLARLGARGGGSLWVKLLRPWCSKLPENGLSAKLAQKAISKKLGSSLGLLGGLI